MPLEEILRQFQQRGGAGGFSFNGFQPGGAGNANRGAHFGGLPKFDLNALGALAKSMGPQGIIYAIPLALMLFQAATSLITMLFRHWYVLLILPLVPKQMRARDHDDPHVESVRGWRDDVLVAAVTFQYFDE